MSEKSTQKTQSLLQIIVIDLLVKRWLMVLLVVLVTLSSISVTWTAQKNRSINSKLALMVNEKSKLDIVWRKLRLEHRSLAEYARIEQLAKRRLNMVSVTTEKETVIK